MSQKTHSLISSHKEYIFDIMGTRTSSENLKPWINGSKSSSIYGVSYVERYLSIVVAM